MNPALNYWKIRSLLSESREVNVRRQVRHSSKGTAYSVRQHQRTIDKAYDELNREVEVTKAARDLIEAEGFRVQEIVDGYTLGREDYKVGNISISTENADDRDEDDEILPGEEESDALIISGNIYVDNRKSGVPISKTSIGQFDRTIDFDNGTVDHDSFSIDKEHQGKGIATDLNTNSFMMYRNVGINRVETYANGGRGKEGIGRYAWAMQGFDFVAEKPHAPNPYPSVLSSLSVVTSKRDTMKSIFEVYLKEKGLVEAASQVKSMNHSWEIASFVVNGEKLGKDFLINHAPDWAGVMQLKPDSDSAKVFKVYSEKAKRK